MHDTARILRTAARYLNERGLHTGEQFAEGTALDICAAIYMAAQPIGAPIPAVFFTDQANSMDLLESSEPAMDALRALSASIDDYKVPDTNGRPDVIEHAFNWTATPGIGQSSPPTTTEVVVRLQRAADQQKPETYCTGDRCEDCTPPTPEDPDNECCEATCGCCPRVDQHGNCFLYAGSQEDSKYCDQHGEGWLNDRSPEAQRKYELLRNA